jgi:hypothetical protein
VKIDRVGDETILLRSIVQVVPLAASVHVSLTLK